MTTRGNLFGKCSPCCAATDTPTQPAANTTPHSAVANHESLVGGRLALNSDWGMSSGSCWCERLAGYRFQRCSATRFSAAIGYRADLDRICGGELQRLLQKCWQQHLCLAVEPG